MDYRKEKDTIFLRIDKDENVLETIENLAKKENIMGGYFQGIGACGKVTLSTYLADKGEFLDHHISSMIEMISLSGNIAIENDIRTLHSHAVFSYLKGNGEIAVVAGHLKVADISYTGESIINLAENKIEKMFDEKTGIDVWKLS